MRKYNLGKNLAVVALAWTMLVMPLATIGQTRVVAPKNKYKVQDDVKLGREYSAQVEQQMPILNDTESTRYLQDVGQRLVNAIPRQFQQPEFEYNFKIVNARDINAFALPGGPMYVNRGMIDAAKNEGEMAGVMAHELSHVVLRHSTAQATKQSGALNQILGIGSILGGAILGGQAGAAIGQTIYQSVFVLPYSRDYETQADVLGAQIMANAGYDPRDLANMFRTIEQQSGGGRAPEFLSTHPNPENRYENINREAQLLRVSSNPVQNTRGFERVQSKLRGLPRAPSMAEIEQNAQRNPQGRTESPTANGRYESSIQLPSARTRVYTGGNFLQLYVPNNWQVFEDQASVTFAPQGAYGRDGITHGAMIGLVQTQSRDLGQATEGYVNGLLQSNNYLRQQSNYSRTTISGRNAYATALAGRSPVTGRTEIVNVYTTQLRNGQLFYIVMVSPESDSSSYNNAFRNMIRSIRLSD
ncbi:MAG: M48 family metalloprotease [Acidobacteriota bacterium]|nr:M48 family metalloprotease [Acidobacteriota bacterium]